MTNNKPPFYIHVTDNGYKYDKRIFWFVILIVVGLFGYIAYLNNFDFSYKFNMKCEGDYRGRGCENTIISQQPKNPYTGYKYYADCKEEWCYSEVLPPGEYGEKPSNLYKNFGMIAFGLVVLGLLLNHLIHNRGKRPGIRPNVSAKTWDKIKDKMENLEE